MSLRCLLRLPDRLQRPLGTLLCFPHAGASGLRYAGLFKDWDLPVRVFVVDYPGHGSRFDEPLRDSIEDIAEEIAGESQSLDDDLPLLLFGHSMGGFVAFETCQILCRQASAPSKLIVSAQRAPHVTRRLQSVNSVTDATFLAELGRLNGMSAEVLQNKELMDMVVPVLRADVGACERYGLKGANALPVPLTVYLGADDLAVSSGEAHLWSELTTAGHMIRVFPGNHFYFETHRAEFQSALAEDFNPLLGCPKRSS